MDPVAASDAVQALQDSPSTEVPDQMSRCRYPGKICRNTRVAKANGSLHRYCAYHRNKANLNQKRWVDRQRASSPTSSSASSIGNISPSSSVSSIYSGRYYRWIMAANPATKHESGPQPEFNLVPRIIITKPKASKPAAPAADVDPVSATAATLSDEDWNGLLAILANDAESETKEDAESNASVVHH